MSNQRNGRENLDGIGNENELPVRVLLVDDEVRNLEVLESILTSPDYELHRAQTAHEAVLRVRRPAGERHAVDADRRDA